MLAATLIAIFLIPLLFVLIERFATRRGGEAHAPREVLATTRAERSSVAGAAIGASGLHDGGAGLQAAGGDDARHVPRAGVAGRGAGASAAAAAPTRPLADQQWSDAVRGRGAARVDHDGARAERRPADRRRAHPAGAGAARDHPRRSVPDRRRAGAGPGPAHVDRRRHGGDARTVGVAQLGAVDWRGSSTSGASTGAPPKSARAQILASEWGRRAIVTSLVSQVATGYFSLRALDFELEIAQRTLDIARGVAAADAGARERRRDVAGGRASGRAAGVTAQRRDRRSAAPHRAAGELPERAARRESRADRARPGADRSAARAGGARRAAVGAARAPPGHPAGRAADRRGERARSAWRGRRTFRRSR